MGHFVLFKKIIILILSFVLISTTVYGKSIETIQTSGDVSAGIEINADGAILMEAETGRVLYEKDADKIASPASITKIMTLILIFDEIKNQGQKSFFLRIQTLHRAVADSDIHLAI